MKLQLTNIDKIANAEIEIKGLTIIAGANNTGKSTVGKALFTVIKALMVALNNTEEQKLLKLKKNISAIYSQLNIIGLDTREMKDEIRQEFSPNVFLNQIINFVDFRHSLLPEIIKDEFVRLMQSKIEFINKIDISPRQKKIVLDELSTIEDIVLENDNNESRLKTEFQSLVASEFISNICSTDTDSSSICFQSDNGTVTLCIEKNKVVDVKLDANFDYSLEDVTFVESSMYLHLIDTLERTTIYSETTKRMQGFGRYPMVTMHIKDLIDKLRDLKYFENKKFDSDNFRISEIIGGLFVYNKNSKSIELETYKDGKTIHYSPYNVASGIKSFGLLQMLLQMSSISERKMLIWDEPENHLHPQWQIDFARIAVELAKSGIPIVISSHSPYFIQGVRFYSNEENMNDYVNYYLAEEDDQTGLSNIKDVTKDLNQIFTKLSEPLNFIMNLK